MNRRTVDREALILRTASRMMLIQYRTTDSTHALISWTGKIFTVHYGLIAGGFVRTASESLDIVVPHDGNGWNIHQLICILEDLR